MRALFVFLFLMSSMPAFAGVQDCDKARSSADVMSCLNRQHESAQGQLNKVFDQLTSQSETEDLVSIKDVQARWVEYRDLECAQETTNLESESLKRIESLRCMTRLMQERIGAIQKRLENDREGEPAVGEAAAQPRWMNALAEDHPEVFWRYGERTEGDLDCDGEPEQIMSGLHVAPETGEVKPVVSVSENPSTGRPESTVIVIAPLNKPDEEAAEPCGLLAKTRYVQKAVEEVEDESDVEAETETETEAMVEEVQACENHLIVIAPRCADMTISWHGNAYAFDE